MILDDEETDTPDAQAGAAADSESRMLLKAISAFTRLIVTRRLDGPKPRTTPGHGKGSGGSREAAAIG
jgi:hypothetical protein